MIVFVLADPHVKPLVFPLVLFHRLGHRARSLACCSPSHMGLDSLPRAFVLALAPSSFQYDCPSRSNGKIAALPSVATAVPSDHSPVQASRPPLRPPNSPQSSRVAPPALPLPGLCLPIGLSALPSESRTNRGWWGARCWGWSL